MRELNKEMENVKYHYQLKERALFDKKEKLFREKKLDKWNCSSVPFADLLKR
jgi:hypothetical protein